jgi:hypothetical protein
MINDKWITILENTSHSVNAKVALMDENGPLISGNYSRVGSI